MLNEGSFLLEALRDRGFGIRARGASQKGKELGYHYLTPLSSVIPPQGDDVEFIAGEVNGTGHISLLCPFYRTDRPKDLDFSTLQWEAANLTDRIVTQREKDGRAYHLHNCELVTGPAIVGFCYLSSPEVGTGSSRGTHVYTFESESGSIFLLERLSHLSARRVRFGLHEIKDRSIYVYGSERVGSDLRDIIGDYVNFAAGSDDYSINVRTLWVEAFNFLTC